MWLISTENIEFFIMTKILKYWIFGFYDLQELFLFFIIIIIKKIKAFTKGTEFLPQTQIFYSLYLCNPLIFQTWIIWSNIIHSLKYLRSYYIGLKEYRDKKIGVCGKNSNPFNLHHNGEWYYMLSILKKMSPRPKLNWCIWKNCGFVIFFFLQCLFPGVYFTVYLTLFLYNSQSRHLWDNQPGAHRNGCSHQLCS